MDITKLSETELKALAYDELKKMNLAQNNIALIEQELQRRESVKEEGEQ